MVSMRKRKRKRARDACPPAPHPEPSETCPESSPESSPRSSDEHDVQVVDVPWDEAARGPEPLWIPVPKEEPADDQDWNTQVWV